MIRLKSLGRRYSKTGKSLQSWSSFLCEKCGKEVERENRSGRIDASCGCTWHDCHVKHGFARVGKEHPLMRVWQGMNGRCHTPGHRDTLRYGARGIFVCADWRHDFPSFLSWCLSNGWMPGLQLDRIDNDGPYSPKNCRFVTPAINVRNSTIAKISVNDAFEIKRLYANGGVSQRSLGKRFGITGQQIGSIVNNKSWKGAQNA